MPRVKRPTKKSRGASSSMEPPPQDHPLAQWFYNNEDFDLYHSDFASRKVIPPSGNHGLILDEDLEIMWRMVNGQQINWVHMFVTHMRRIKPENSKGLPYAILWTAIFKYVGIDLSQADKKRLGYNNCIETHVLNHMKRNIQEAPQQEQEAPQQEEEAPQQEEEAQPQEPQAQPSEQPSDQPSLRDIMQAIQAMELNVNQRMDKIEKNQVRMLRKIRRVEAYTFDEDEAEDDDDDFWS
ncbi:hypothetical protein PIB30_102633 [Stylosanthes scabra]|uniref:Uncharacterized protein n=1 Tax=Stylosanthes scabra TaxID=79078 RepID=A0ABU6TYB3_9FABA|nr:hypothetical protein [Stylosanthes scabra]